jgi:coenzyme F420-reducing hydrogenase delta subunit
VVKLKEKLAGKGINPDRLMLEWVSAAEGQRFVSAVQKMDQLDVAEEEIELSKMIFSEPRKKKVKKKAMKDSREMRT